MLEFWSNKLKNNVIVFNFKLLFMLLPNITTIEINYNDQFDLSDIYAISNELCMCIDKDLIPINLKDIKINRKNKNNNHTDSIFDRCINDLILQRKKSHHYQQYLLSIETTGSGLLYCCLSICYYKFYIIKVMKNIMLIYGEIGINHKNYQ